MNTWCFLLRNIRFYRRSWALTLAGSVIGTAVLTGALITGDSVRDTLQAMVHQRLGSVTIALSTGDRHVRLALARELSAASGIQVSPVLIVPATAGNPEKNLQVNRLQVAGIDSTFMELWQKVDSPEWTALCGEDEALISSSLANRLQLKAGDAVVVRINQAGFAPHNAPFVSDQAEVTGMRLTVRAIISDDLGGKFSLATNQAAPFNLFIRHDMLAGKAGLKGFVNTLLIADPDPNPGWWKNQVKQHWQADDAGLSLSKPESGVIQINSRRIFVDEVLADTIMRHFPMMSPFITYLVNELSFDGRQTPYSFVTATDMAPGGIRISPGEMVVTDWLADDLGAKMGDTLQIRFWTMGVNRILREEQADFRIRAVIRLQESASLKALMPDFPGMSKSGSCRDWESGVPVDLGRIRDKDENYWKQHKGTPKAWISWQDGLRLWKSRFGKVTAFRIREPFDIQKLDAVVQRVDPASLGLTFRAVRDEGVRAAGQSTDFGELFLSLGGLIVISGLLLSGMMLALFLRTRQSEMALLLAVGFRRSAVRNLYLAETVIVSFLGGVAGVALATGYAALIISGLNTLWHGAVQTDGLILHVTGKALFSGFLSGFIMNIAIFFWLIHRFNKAQRSSGAMPTIKTTSAKPGLRLIIAVSVMILTVLALGLVALEITGGRFFPSTIFMVSGLLIMLAIFGGLFLFITRKRDLTSATDQVDLSLKHLALKPVSNLGTIALLAFGIFAILLTGTNRKSGDNDDFSQNSGTGGFRWWMETTMPLPNDLNSKDGLKKVGLEAEPALKGARFFPLPVVSGDDASCLNLNRVAKPSLLGVPAIYFDSIQSFSFVSLTGDVDRDHPWRMLINSPSDSLINGYADQTVITWGLGMKTGDTLFYADEQGNSLKIRIAGGIDNSVFQGYLLVSDSMLRSRFPSLARPFISLIETTQPSGDSLDRLLSNRLANLGAEVASTSARLQEFNTVENTYLSVFMVLGGFGVLLGTAGLAVLILRNLHDRREEFILYEALGFPLFYIRKMLLLEFGFVLYAGVISGGMAALWASLPSWWGAGITTLFFPGIIVLMVTLAGSGWVWWVVRKRTSSFPADQKPGASGLS